MNSTLPKIQKARTGLILDNPFYGFLSLRLKIQESDITQTAATDGVHFFYNKGFIDSLRDKELEGLWAHEIMHIALMHNLRAGNRDNMRWNIACDYAINILLQHQFTLPKGGLLDSSYKSMSAEAIYAILPDGPSSSQKGKWGEVLPLPKGMEPGQAEADMKVALKQATATAKAMGKFPGNLMMLIDEITNPKLCWQDILRRFVSECAANEYSWARFNRRYVSQGMYLPGMHNHTLGDIVLAIDTSGSCVNDLGKFASEFSSILEEYQTTATILWIDAKVANVQVVNSTDLPLELIPMGGGGTSFTPAFEWVTEAGMQPTCLIYFTDLMGRFPKEHPTYPVLWVSTLGNMDVPFGEMIHLA